MPAGVRVTDHITQCRPIMLRALRIETDEIFPESAGDPYPGHRSVVGVTPSGCALLLFEEFFGQFRLGFGVITLGSMGAHRRLYCGEESLSHHLF